VDSDIDEAEVWSEWDALLGPPVEDDRDYATVGELAERYHLAENTMRRRVKKLVETGQADVKRIRRPGARQSVMGYKVVSP